MIQLFPNSNNTKLKISYCSNLYKNIIIKLYSKIKINANLFCVLFFQNFKINI